MFFNLQNYILNEFQSGLMINSPFMFIMAFFAGVLASFTPCVYPMIPVMVGAFQKYSDGSSKKGFLYSLVFVITFTGFYVVLGIIAGMTGVLVGKISASPWINLFSAIVIFILSLSMFGLFEIRFPQIEVKRSGIVYMVLLGGISSVIFSACAVPVLATILFFIAHTQNMIFGALLLMFFSLGMGSLFIFFGILGGKFWFKSGRFLKASKIILGFLVLFISIHFFYRFIKFL